MKRFEHVPVNFTLTPAAEATIERLTSELEASGQQSYVPAVLWHEEYEERERKLKSYGVALGWFEASRVPANEIETLGRLRILFGVTPKQAENFKGKALDFDGERFLLVG